MRAKKLPSGNWRCRVSIGKVKGKYRYKSFTAPTKKEAEYLATTYLMEHNENDANSPTIGEAINVYIDKHRPVSSPSTVREWVKMERRYYNDIKDIHVCDFNTADAQEFINAIAESHEPKTVRNIYGFLATSICYADEDKVLRPTLPKKKKTQYYIPSNEEVKRLIASADPELKKAIVLSSVGTLRRGEVCGIDYNDIQDTLIHIHRVKVMDENKKWVVKDIPKTDESDRWVDYPQEIIDLLGEGEGFVVNINPDRVTDRFCKLRNKLEIPTRFHDLRHYAASIMHALGVPDQYIMERGGWKSDTVLKQVYRNILEDHRNTFTDKTNEYLKNAIL
jgi:integrase